jgi:ABC-type molybdate transport system substrate-binding protein
VPSWAGELSGKLVIFNAGSLSVPLKTIEKNFEQMHPGLDSRREPSGSSKAARKVSDLEKPRDIMASADYEVIDKLLVPNCADWTAGLPPTSWSCAIAPRANAPTKSTRTTGIKSVAQTLAAAVKERRYPVFTP